MSVQRALFDKKPVVEKRGRGAIEYPRLPDIGEWWFWIAGLYEGEGSCTSLTKQENGGVTVRVCIPSTDLDVLRRLQSLVGGTVGVQRANNGAKWKTCYQWSISDAQRAWEFLCLIKPFLLDRRHKQVSKVLSDVEGILNRRYSTDAFGVHWGEPSGEWPSNCLPDDVGIVCKDAPSLQRLSHG